MCVSVCGSGNNHIVGMWVWPNYHLPDVYLQLTVGGADPSLMDSGSKTGKVYLRPHRPGKKWKPVLLSLFPPSTNGVGRLEIQDVAGGGAAGDLSGGVRRHHPHLDRKVKVVRLSEVLSVLRLPPNAEACPMENMSAFCVESQDRTLVFAALKDDCVDWVDKLCLSSFKTGNSSANAPARMEENQIYASADEAPRFWVVVQKTEAATRCGLEGPFWLEVGGASLLLREAQKKIVVGEWPYEQLRRYGSHQSVLTIEAGRRCSSGPGIFSFESSQVDRIFSLIQSSIKQRAPPSAPRSPLPKTPSMAAALETKLKIQGRKSPSLEEGPHAQEDRGGQPDATPAPITLMPLPLLPTQTPPSRRAAVHQSDGIYADPAECAPPTMKPPPTKALYIDPARVLPLKPPGAADSPPPQTDQRDSVYSEVLDRVSPHQNQQSGDPETERPEEPVYAEPTAGAEPEPDRTENKPDPFAQLYAKVCKPHKGPPPESENRTGATPPPTRLTRGEEPPDDVIYENLGII
uniref:Docking protein 3-like n=2 Tax=Oryzias melastigma TaxID=30732 RepID=A0A3B3BSH7_ORYME